MSMDIPKAPEHYKVVIYTEHSTFVFKMPNAVILAVLIDFKNPLVPILEVKDFSSSGKEPNHICRIVKAHIIALETTMICEDNEQ